MLVYIESWLYVCATLLDRSMLTKVFALKKGCMFLISVTNDIVGRNDLTFSGCKWFDLA